MRVSRSTLEPMKEVKPEGPKTRGRRESGGLNGREIGNDRE